MIDGEVTKAHKGLKKDGTMFQEHQFIPKGTPLNSTDSDIQVILAKPSQISETTKQIPDAWFKLETSIF